MSLKTPIFEVGYDKNGEVDFAISGRFTQLNKFQMDDIRQMIIVAIGVAEGMYHRSRELLEPASQTKKKLKEGGQV